MVNTLAQPRLVVFQLRAAAHVPLERDFRPALDLVVEALAGVFVGVEHEVVEEGRDGVLRDCAVGEAVYLELRGAAVQADVAVAGGEDFARGAAVEGHGEGQVEFAVGVVLGVVWWVAVVAGGWGGEA